MKDTKELTKIKSQDFKDVVDGVIKEHYSRGEFIKKSYAIELAINMPAPRFYTTVETSMRRINQLLKNADIPLSTPIVKEMYWEIYHRYFKAIEENPLKYKPDIMEMVINQPAPKFYISKETAKTLVYDSKRNKR